MADIEKWKQPLINLTKEVVGYSSVLLDGDKKICRIEECNLGMRIEF